MKKPTHYSDCIDALQAAFPANNPTLSFLSAHTVLLTLDVTTDFKITSRQLAWMSELFKSRDFVIGISTDIEYPRGARQIVQILFLLCDLDG